MKSQTSCWGASILIDSLSLIASRDSPDHGQAPFGGEPIERVLHQPSDVVVDLIYVRAPPKLLPQVNRVEDVDRDLRRQRNVTEEVTDVEAPRQGEGDRQHLQPEE